MTYAIRYSHRARRAVAELLPESVAAACVEFIGGALAAAPHRVGRQLHGPLAGLHSARRGQFRLIYRIDEAEVVVLIVTIDHRRDVYRP